MTHENEITSSRIGGFGGSDAAMFLKIGGKGIDSLSNTDRKRISVAKGIIKPTQIDGNEAMQRGHDFEDWYHERFKNDYQREAVLSCEIGTKFKTFCHADFYDPKLKKVVELKCVKEPLKALEKYKAQLQWYYLMGANMVFLVVSDSTYFDFESGLQEPIFVEKDLEIIDLLAHGIELLSDNWGNVIENESINEFKNEHNMKCTEITMQIVKNLGNYETARLEAKYLIDTDMITIEQAFINAKIDLENSFLQSNREILTETSKRFEAVCTALKSNQTTIEKVKEVFIITSQMDLTLKNLTK